MSAPFYTRTRNFQNGVTPPGVSAPTLNEYEAAHQTASDRVVALESAFVSVSVKGYGAKGDGSTDDTTAIQSAINAAAAAGGGCVTFPTGTYMISVPVLVKDRVRLLGTSRSATTIKATAGFTGTYMIRLGAGTGIVFGATVEHMQVHANDVAAVCVYTNESQELSGVFDAALTHFRDTGLRLNAGMRFGSFERLELYGSASGWSYGADLDSCTGPVLVSSVTINSNNSAVLGTAGIRVAATAINAFQIHGEKLADTILFDTGGSGVVASVDATTGVTGRAVRIVSGNAGRITLLGVGSVNDQVSALDSATFQAVYVLDGTGTGASKARFSLDPATPALFGNKLTFRSSTVKVRNHQSNVSGAVTLDLSFSDYQQLTLAGNITITATNFVDGQEVTLAIVQGGTGSYTVTWPSGVRWAGNSAPTLSTAVNTHDVFKFLIIGSRMREVSRSLGTVA